MYLFFYSPHLSVKHFFFFLKSGKKTWRIEISGPNERHTPPTNSPLSAGKYDGHCIQFGQWRRRPRSCNPIVIFSFFFIFDDEEFKESQLKKKTRGGSESITYHTGKHAHFFFVEKEKSDERLDRHVPRQRKIIISRVSSKTNFPFFFWSFRLKLAESFCYLVYCVWC